MLIDFDDEGQGEETMAAHCRGRSRGQPSDVCSHPSREADRAGSRAKPQDTGLQPELEGDAVGVIERHEPPEVEHAHAHGGVGYPEIVEMGDPSVELTLVGHLEREVVEARAAVVEGADRAVLATRYDTVYDGVLGPWFLPRFMAATGLDALDYVILLPSVDRCVQRIAARRDHGFSDEPATRTMHEQFSCAEIESRHVLMDPPDRPDDVADLIEVARASQSLTFT